MRTAGRRRCKSGVSADTRSFDKFDGEHLGRAASRGSGSSSGDIVPEAEKFASEDGTNENKAESKNGLENDRFCSRKMQ